MNECRPSLNLPNRFDKIVIDQDPELESEQRQYKTVWAALNTGDFDKPGEKQLSLF